MFQKVGLKRIAPSATQNDCWRTSMIPPSYHAGLMGAILSLPSMSSARALMEVKVGLGELQDDQLGDHVVSQVPALGKAVRSIGPFSITCTGGQGGHARRRAFAPLVGTGRLRFRSGGPCAALASSGGLGHRHSASRCACPPSSLSQLFSSLSLLFSFV